MTRATPKSHRLPHTGQALPIAGDALRAARPGAALRSGLAIYVLLLFSVLTTGCLDPKVGGLSGTFEYDGTVTSMNLEGIGVGITGELPELEKDYALEPGEATILWTASGTTYSLAITIVEDKGEKAEDPTLIPLSFGKVGGDGQDKLLFFEFAAESVTISERFAVYTGVELP